MGEGQHKTASNDRVALRAAGSREAPGNEETKIRGSPSDDHDETIRLTDKNGDGKLTVDEIIGFSHEAMKHFPGVEFESNDRKIAKHFAETDANHDSFLDVKELAEFKKAFWALEEEL